MATVRAPRVRAAKAPDAVLVAAVDRARQAIEEIAPAGDIGEHEGYLPDEDRVLTHFFTCLAKGYRGWRWSVTVTRVPRGRTATVSEVVLLPGPESVLAPTWVPWADRLAPGDLGDTDTLPYRADDPRLEPGYAATDGSDDDEDGDRLAVWELGLGRPRVLSPEGRAEAATRWYEGPNGPIAEAALHAHCVSCGFYLQLAGSLRQTFGVCANEWSPSDGQVVSADHGCGAHSETDVEHPEPERLPDLILDELGPDSITVLPRDLSRREEDLVEVVEPVAEVVAEAEPVAEDGVSVESGEPVAEVVVETGSVPDAPPPADPEPAETEPTDPERAEP